MRYQISPRRVAGFRRRNRTYSDMRQRFTKPLGSAVVTPLTVAAYQKSCPLLFARMRMKRTIYTPRG